MKKITYYVGLGQDKDGADISPSEVAVGLNAIRYILADEFKGYTEVLGSGGWFNTIKLVEEKQVSYVIYADITDDLSRVRAVAELLKITMRQSCVLFTVEEVLHSEFV